MAGYFINRFGRIVFFLIFFLCTAGSYAQNARDIFIKDSIHPVLNTDAINEKAAYLKVKKNIAVLEKQYGYETNLKRRLLEAAFTHNDLTFFKEEMTLLVRDHGLDAAYFRESESYYTAVMFGSLSQWFKKMYLTEHVVWLDKNFDKQTDLRKLNTMHAKDQALTAFAMSVLNVRGLDSVQQEKIKMLLGGYHLKNFEPLLDIAQKRKMFPNENNFATLQNGYDTTMIHNFQFPANMDNVWTALFPYIKKAYAQNEITDVIFRNYDFYHYQHYGSQVFDSYTYDKIPNQFRQKQNPIPIKDKVWLNAFKKEFGWAD